ncbi:Thionin [Thalictrum thalictroides]|uniref:Thionin n=1 Tax=Thalictrum thalictroides TaxID=46969 RepID=A0A7J6UTA6_THATH|nr:Thionin [Thalictrum thalictroides]
MEGKTVIFSVLILSLVLAQVQVEALICCQGPWGRTCYVSCSLTPFGKFGNCVSACGCVDVSGECPSGYPSLISLLKNSAGASFNRYCKVGCASSVYATLQNSGQDAGEEIMKEAVEHCTNACSSFGTKGSSSALEIA